VLDALRHNAYLVCPPLLVSTRRGRDISLYSNKALFNVAMGAQTRLLMLHKAGLTKPSIESHDLLSSAALSIGFCCILHYVDSKYLWFKVTEFLVVRRVLSVMSKMLFTPLEDVSKFLFASALHFA